MYDFKSLKQPKNIKSGVAEYALLAPFAWFAVNGVKSPVAPFTNPGDSLTIKTPHVFLADKGFMYFTLAPQKNKYSYKTVGDLGFNSFNSELKIFIAGSYEAAHETVKNLLNVPLIVLQKDAVCEADMFYQLGCDCQFAYLTVNFDTGTTKDGVKGFDGTITYDDGPQFYKVTNGPQLLADVAGGGTPVVHPTFSKTLTMGASPQAADNITLNATANTGNAFKYNNAGDPIANAITMNIMVNGSQQAQVVTYDNLVGQDCAYVMAGVTYYGHFAAGNVTFAQ